MNALPVAELLWLLVLAPLVALGVLAVLYGVLEDRKEKQTLSNIYQCEHCRLVYVDTRKVPICRCPRCRKLNEAIRR
jgi:hypothetical protein